MGKLSARGVATAQPGRYGDGAGLWLHVAPGGGKKWVYRFTFNGRVRETGLGSASVVGLGEAREKAQEARLLVARGIDPIEAKKAAKAAATTVSVPTFGAVADMVFAAKEPSWRSSSHARQWISSIRTYAALILGTPVDRIDRQAALSVLQPIWLTVPEPARRVSARGENILDYATVHGWRSGENPFRLKGALEHVLPKRQRLEQAHFAAMRPGDVPLFVSRLCEQETVVRLALEFLILTASRLTEALGATWPEIDFAGKIWVVPGSRMKAGITHRVPWAPRALGILDTMRQYGEAGYIFKGRQHRPVSSSTLRRLVPAGATVHGFRASFSTWCAEQGYPRELCEESLAHHFGNAVERSYRRTDLLERRRQLMESSAAYLAGAAVDNVVSIGARK